MPPATLRKKGLPLFPVWVALLALSFGTPEAFAQQDPKALYQAAKGEGVVVWYTSFPLDEATPVAEASQKRHPGVKVEIVRGSGTRLIGRFETEYRAGRGVADVMTGALRDPCLATRPSAGSWSGSLPRGVTYRPSTRMRDSGAWRASRSRA